MTYVNKSQNYYVCVNVCLHECMNVCVYISGKFKVERRIKYSSGVIIMFSFIFLLLLFNLDSDYTALL